MTVNKPSDLSLFSVLLPPAPISGKPAGMSTVKPGYPDESPHQSELNGGLLNSVHINGINPYWLTKSQESLFWFLSS